MFGLLISLILIQISQLEANESKRPKHDGILPVLVQQVRVFIYCVLSMFFKPDSNCHTLPDTNVSQVVFNAFKVGQTHAENKLFFSEIQHLV